MTIGGGCSAPPLSLASVKTYSEFSIIHTPTSSPADIPRVTWQNHEAASHIAVCTLPYLTPFEGLVSEHRHHLGVGSLSHQTREVPREEVYMKVLATVHSPLGSHISHIYIYDLLQ